MSEEDLRDQLDAYRGDIYRLRGELEDAQAEAAALWGELEGTQRWLAKVGADEGYPTAVTVAKEIARKLDDAKRAHTFLDRLRKAEELAEKTERERDEARRRHDFYMECLETVLGPVRERRATGEPAESDRTAVKRIIYQRDNLQARVKELEAEVDRLKHQPNGEQNKDTILCPRDQAYIDNEKTPSYATKAEVRQLAYLVKHLCAHNHDCYVDSDDCLKMEDELSKLAAEEPTRDDVPPVKGAEGESSRDLPEDPLDLVGAPHGGGPGG